MSKIVLMMGIWGFSPVCSLASVLKHTSWSSTCSCTASILLRLLFFTSYEFLLSIIVVTYIIHSFLFPICLYFCCFAPQKKRRGNYAGKKHMIWNIISSYIQTVTCLKHDSSLTSTSNPTGLFRR